MVRFSPRNEKTVIALSFQARFSKNIVKEGGGVVGIRTFSSTVRDGGQGGGLLNL